jgi:hypothetical protein
MWKMHNISLCGIPYSGKKEIMHRLLEMNESARTSLTKESTQGNNILHLNIGDSLKISTIHGNYLSLRKTYSLLPKQDIIIYIIDPLAERSQSQYIFLKQFLLFSKERNILWNTIPWIWVLNKIDYSTENPLIDIIPKHFHDKIINCSAIQNKGIDKIWQRIIVLLNNYNSSG